MRARLLRLHRAPPARPATVSVHAEADYVPLLRQLPVSGLVVGAHDRAVVPAREARLVREGPLRLALREQQDRAPAAARLREAAARVEEAAAALPLEPLDR